MKFIVVLVVIGLAALTGLWVGRRFAHRQRRELGAEANARLTGYVAVVLLILLAAETLTGVRPGLLAHALIGFLLVPPVLLKVGSVTYRFVRYYRGNAAYRAAGPPQIVMRLMGPALIALTTALFATGIELWLFGLEFGDQWRAWHQAAFLLWFLAMTVHVVAYLRRAPELAFADWHERLPGAFARRSLVLATLVFGLALAVAMLPFQSPFILPPNGG